MKIHQHLWNDSDRAIKVYASCLPASIEIRAIQENQARIKLEEQLWQSYVTAEPNTRKTIVDIPAKIDYWSPLETPNVITDQLIKELQTTKTVYFVGRIRDARMNTPLLDFCVRTNPDDSQTMIFCSDHN
jgi:hypothetical protein